MSQSSVKNSNEERSCWRFITHIYIYFRNNCFRNDHARRNLFVPKHSSPTSNILQLGDELAWKKTSLKLLTIPWAAMSAARVLLPEVPGLQSDRRTSCPPTRVRSMTVSTASACSAFSYSTTPNPRIGLPSSCASCWDKIITILN